MDARLFAQGGEAAIDAIELGDGGAAEAVDQGDDPIARIQRLDKGVLLLPAAGGSSQWRRVRP